MPRPAARPARGALHVLVLMAVLLTAFVHPCCHAGAGLSDAGLSGVPGAHGHGVAGTAGAGQHCEAGGPDRHEHSGCALVARAPSAAAEGALQPPDPAEQPAAADTAVRPLPWQARAGPLRAGLPPPTPDLLLTTLRLRL